MYKCCWNCANGLRACAKTKDEEDGFNSSKRFCFAPYPVSNHSVNPFKQRYCKQFEPHIFVSFGHEITKEEAKKLNEMSVDELVKYWEKVLSDVNENKRNVRGLRKSILRW